MNEEQFAATCRDRVAEWGITPDKYGVFFPDEAMREENERLRGALEEIRDAKSRWQQNVGSYAGGETYAGFAQRLQNLANAALASPVPEEKKCP